MYLFFYGILQRGLGPDDGGWPFLAGLGSGTPARTRGALYAIRAGSGWYPALIPADGPDATIVQGMLHDGSEVDLAAVDEFEGAQYSRQSIAVEGGLGVGEIRAEAYIWIADLPADAEVIGHGDFACWLRDTGRAPFAQD